MKIKNGRTVLIAVVIVMMLALSGCSLFDSEAPVISLNAKELDIEVGNQMDIDVLYEVEDDYTEEPQVTVDNNVDLDAVGTYEVVIEAMDDRENSSSETIVVNVVDTVSPSIELEGDAHVVIDYNDVYNEPGYVVSDNYDEHLEVTIEGSVNAGVIGDYVLLYSTSDTSGNTTSVERTVIVKDLTAPELTVNGDTEVEILLGMVYEDLGCLAHDEIDGETEVVTKILDSDGLEVTKLSSAGTFTINYSATDAEGNYVELNRLVHVKPIIATSNENIELIINGVDFNKSSMLMDEGMFIIDITVNNDSSNGITFPPFFEFYNESGSLALEFEKLFFMVEPDIVSVDSGESVNACIEFGYEGDVNSMLEIVSIKYGYSSDDSYYSLPYAIDFNVKSLLHNIVN